MKTEIIYEDAALLVIYKPAGLAVQTASVTQKDVATELCSYLNTSYVGLVHRLDQPVEGLLVVAKTKKAAAALSRQLADGTLDKTYYAVVHDSAGSRTENNPAGGKTENNPAGTADGKTRDNPVGYAGSETKDSFTDNAKYKTDNGFTDNTGYKTKNAHATSDEHKIGKANSQEWVVLRDYMVKDAKTSTARIVTELSEAKRPPKTVYAELSYRFAERREGMALLEVRLTTGRFHQIRAQLSHSGMPLLGDRKYASPDSQIQSQQCGVTDVALCAYSLSFRHPASNKKMEFKIMPHGTVFQNFAMLRESAAANNT
jgi:23S rRNA pseudouridine1911/1915/1917 synthase